MNVKKPHSVMLIGALGVVFGDIGTSPLYALKAAFGGEHAIALTPPHIFGVLSLIFWSLILIVCLKYAVFLLRADNRQEGGLIALMALALKRIGDAPGQRSAVMGIGLAGTALFFGDGLLTPAITVLGAVEGLEVVALWLKPYEQPLALAVLGALFFVQARGSSRLGTLFSPIMLVWFVTIGALGLRSIWKTPLVLDALDPSHAARFLIETKWQSLIVLGAVVLAITGAEALYADLGHFGADAIRRVWVSVVLPALVLNYFGQGALLLRDSSAAGNPFYRLAPDFALVPLLLLSTAATVIASQAVLSGTFSLARQASQLGFLPRLRVIHTFREKIGQVYLPAINWLLMAGVFALVLGFGSAAELAAAYGIAVTGTMVASTLLGGLVLPTLWGWSRAFGVLVMGTFLVFDVSFLAANSLKLSSGGWAPLAVSGAILLIMSTWKRGREILVRRLNERAMSMEDLLEQLRENPPAQVPGTAIYLTAGRRGVPETLLHNLRTNKMIHERVLILTVVTQDVPWVPREERIKIRHFGDALYRIKIYYGFKQAPNIPDALALCREWGLPIDLETTSFFIARETMISTPRPGMARWRERLFIRLARNAETAMEAWRIPPDRVVELGLMVEI